MTDDSLTHLAALSQPASLAGINRRRFLQGLLASGALAGAGVAAWPRSAGAAVGPANDHVLVVILMNGGNDGLDMVIPANNGHYQSSRGALALGPTTLPIGSGLWFHENLPGISARYQAGDVAIVQGVGDDQPDLSHFEAMARRMTGHSDGIRSDFTGWLGRWHDDAAAGDFGIVNIGDGGIPMHLRGNQAEAVGIPSNGAIIGLDVQAWERTAFDRLVTLGQQGTGRGGLFDYMGEAMGGALTAGTDIGPVVDGLNGLSGLERDMVIAAQTINLNVSLDLGVRVASVRYGDFDTHKDHPDVHPGLMLELDQAVTAFYNTLDASLVNKVTIMTMSEFGRSLTANDSEGIDHGTASTNLVIGSQVVGGLYGAMPSFTDLDVRGDVKLEVDFRALYGTMITEWLGGDADDILGGPWEKLGLFARCNGLVPTHYGTDGIDLIQGTPGDDVIVAFGGNDRIFGGGGADVICAGDGRDRVIGGDGDDLIFGEDGGDFLYAEDGDDTVYGGTGDDRVLGGNGEDRIFGQGGDDVLYGHGGADEIHGNHGNDRLFGGGSADTLKGSAGDDILRGDAGPDSLFGGADDDIVFGNAGADNHDGEAGIDDCRTDGDAGDTFANCE